jgi:hypothetical protein
MAKRHGGKLSDKLSDTWQKIKHRLSRSKFGKMYHKHKSISLLNSETEAKARAERKAHEASVKAEMAKLDTAEAKLDTAEAKEKVANLEQKEKDLIKKAAEHFTSLMGGKKRRSKSKRHSRSRHSGGKRRRSRSKSRSKRRHSGGKRRRSRSRSKRRH